VLVRKRAVETEVVPDRPDVLGRRSKAQHRTHRVARNEPDDEEDEDAHRDQRGNRQCGAGDEEPRARAHVPPSSSTRLASSRSARSVKRKCSFAMCAARSAAPLTIASTSSPCWTIAVRRMLSLYGSAWKPRLTWVRIWRLRFAR